jgi:hypothetical protein
MRPLTFPLIMFNVLTSLQVLSSAMTLLLSATMSPTTLPNGSTLIYIHISLSMTHSFPLALMTLHRPLANLSCSVSQQVPLLFQLIKLSSTKLRRAAYRECWAVHLKSRLSTHDPRFKHVVTFNMDEYVGIPRDHSESYHTFMFREFFSHSPSSPLALAEESCTNFINPVDIPPSQVNLLDGNAEDLVAECNAYESRIKQYGGIELFLGGIGEDGHIAFNEPGMPRSFTFFDVASPVISLPYHCSIFFSRS